MVFKRKFNFDQYVYVKMRLWGLGRGRERKKKCTRGLLALLFFRGSSNHVEKWFNNEAHGGLYGIYMNEDGLPGCSLIQGFTIWSCWDYGIYFQVKGIQGGVYLFYDTVF